MDSGLSMGSISDGIKKNWRLILFIAGLIILFWVLWALRSVFLPFILGFIFAYLLMPVIKWIEKHLPGKKQRFKRILRTITIVIVYVLAIAIVGLVVFYLITAIMNAFSTITIDTSQLIPNGLNAIKNWIKSLPFLSSESMQTNIDTYFSQLGDQLPTVLIDFLSRGWQLVSTSIGTIAGFIILPIFIFYLLNDWEGIRDRFYAGQSPWVRKHTSGVLSILQDVVIRYVRGELLLGLVVGTATYILLAILRIPFALPLAIFSAATELVPMIGPWIGGGLGVLVTLAVAPDKWLWVAIGYGVIQLLENQLLVPKIQGSFLKIHPAVVIILSILGAYFAGILGFIIILPVTMIIVRLFRYFKASFQENNLLDRSISDDYLPPDEM
jgi:predicted PurR-regulated permease PerM